MIMLAAIAARIELSEALTAIGVNAVVVADAAEVSDRQPEAGWDALVIDLGADVPTDKVVSACKEHQPVMVTGTALMTTTMTAFPKIAHQLRQANLQIPFICGGGAVCEEYVTEYDLGIWGKEASQAPGMAEDALSGESWESMRGKWNG